MILATLTLHFAVVEVPADVRSSSTKVPGGPGLQKLTGWTCKEAGHRPNIERPELPCSNGILLFLKRRSGRGANGFTESQRWSRGARPPNLVARWWTCEVEAWTEGMADARHVNRSDENRFCGRAEI